MTRRTAAPPPPQKPLDEEVRELLEAHRDATWRKIARGCGAVSEAWISMFMAGKIGDPGYKRLSALRDYLLTLPPVAVAEEKQA